MEDGSRPSSMAVAGGRTTAPIAPVPAVGDVCHRVTLPFVRTLRGPGVAPGASRCGCGCSSPNPTMVTVSHGA